MGYYIGIVFVMFCYWALTMWALSHIDKKFEERFDRIDELIKSLLEDE